MAARSNSVGVISVLVIIGLLNASVSGFIPSWALTQIPKASILSLNRVNVKKRHPTPLLHDKNDDRDQDIEEEEEDDDDDDEIKQTAYGNRSLAWTKHYRRVIPYEVARAQAMSLGLSSKEEWHTLVRKGPYMISRPDEMYQEEWISWEEFLGAMRPYEETKHLVQNVLRLKSMEEYRAFVQMDPKRAEGLRIPAKPEIVYKSKGWQGSEVFFGTNANSK